MLSAKRVVELLQSLPWRQGELIRAVWVRVGDGGRSDFAAAILAMESADPIVPVIVREVSFLTANALLSDVNRLLEGNRDQIKAVPIGRSQRLTIAILSKEEFRLPQISSPVTLPKWFPLLGGREVIVRLADIASQGEVDLLNCEEMRSEQISSMLYDLEKSLVQAFGRVALREPMRLDALLREMYAPPKDPVPSASEATVLFRKHLTQVQDPRAYRPTLKPNSSILSRLLKIVLRSSPDQLASVARLLVAAFQLSGDVLVKPPLFAILLRPTSKLEPSERNMHGMLLAMYEGYQVLTGVAHAGDYPWYPVGLLHATSVDIRTSLRDYCIYMNHVEDA